MEVSAERLMAVGEAAGEVMGYEQAKAERVIQLLSRHFDDRVSPEIGGTIMEYLAERLMVVGKAAGEAMGEAVGYIRGRFEGRVQGMAQGKAEALTRLMEHRFNGDLTPELQQRITGASIEELEEWFARALDAQSVDAVFNGKPGQ